MSSLAPRAPFDPPSIELNPLDPPFIAPILRASDALADAHAQIAASVNQALAAPRTALSVAQIQVGQAVNQALANPQLALAAAHTGINGAIETGLAQAFSSAADSGAPGVSPLAVAQAIQGGPLPTAGTPPHGVLDQATPWQFFTPQTGGSGYLGQACDGAWWQALPDGAGGWGYSVNHYGPPVPGCGVATPPLTPPPPPTPPTCEQVMQQQAGLLISGRDTITLPLYCPCPPGYTEGSHVTNDFGLGYGPQPAKQCNPPGSPAPPPYTPPPPPYTPPAPPSSPPAPPCPTWKAWKGDVCYILPGDQPPRDEGDTLIVSGTPTTEWVSALCRACGAPPPEPGESHHDPDEIDIEGCLGLVTGKAWEATDLVELVNQLFGIDQAAPAADLGWWGEALARSFGSSGEMIRGFQRAVVRALVGPLDAASRIANCGPPEVLPINLTLMALGFISKYVTDPPPAVTRPLEQRRNYLCPTELPSPAEADGAWLADAIDEETWACWTRAAGDLEDQARTVRDAARAKLTAGELAALHNRGELTDQQYQARLRQGGWIQPTDAGEIDTLSQQIPVLSDLLRFMVRDAGDDQLAQRFGMDDDFAQKWTGELKRFADWQNIHPDYAKLAWRSHWDIPPLTQLASMYHRLRHPWIPPAEQVTLEDVETALRQDDKLPYWIPKLLAISFLPLGRIDVRRAYQIGVLDVEGMRRRYLDIGYSDTDAQTLTDYTVKLVREQWANSPIVAKMVSYKISKAEGQKRLQQAGASDADITEVMRRVDLSRSVATRQKCQQGIKRRYLKYELSTPEARAALLLTGAEIDEASCLSEAWECERSARGKVLPASQVCGLYERGLIQISDLYGRFLAIGYSQSDASLMAIDCARRVQAKIDKRQQDLIDKQAALYAKNLKEQERLARQLAQQEAKFVRDNQTAQDKLTAQQVRLAKLRAGQVKLEEQRRKQVMSAAETIVAWSGEDLAQTYQQMMLAIRQSVPTWWFNQTAATDAATIASKDPSAISYAAWLALWQGLSAAAAAGPGSDLPPTLEVEVAQSIPGSLSDPATTQPAGT